MTKPYPALRAWRVPIIHHVYIWRYDAGSGMYHAQMHGRLVKSLELHVNQQQTDSVGQQSLKMKGLPTTRETPHEKVSKVEKGSTDVSGDQAPEEDNTPLLAKMYSNLSTRQILLLIGAPLYILLLCFWGPIKQVVNSVLHPSGDISINPYAAGLASHGWKFGDDQLVDSKFLDRIVLEWSRQEAKQEEGGSDTARVMHHQGDMNHYQCNKHRHHPHSIGPKEAEALFLTVPKNDSLAA